MSLVNSIVFQLTLPLLFLYNLSDYQLHDRGGDSMDRLIVAAAGYRAIQDRIRAVDPQIDEQTLSDTVEGLTDLHEILTAIIRAALADQALATGLEGRIAEMEARRDRLQDRAAKRRQIAKDAMVEVDLKKLSRPPTLPPQSGPGALPSW
jgi:hypothetical protein